MESRLLGRTGVRVSALCLGTMQFGWTADEESSWAILDRAVELGITFLDTADIYSRWVDGNRGGESEVIIGKWLTSRPSIRRQVILATKVRGQIGPAVTDQGLSRLHIIRAVEDSLRRLQTDVIDLYQVHWPDDETPLDETLRALDDVVQSGKVRYVGCSNFPAWLLVKALWISDVRDLVRFESLQPHYNLVHREEFERELQPVCMDQGLGVIPYSPLAGGFLTGKYRRASRLPQTPRATRVQERYMNDKGFATIDLLEQLGRDRNASVAQMAIAWVLANRTVTSAIIGANSVEQLEDTAKGVDVVLDPSEKATLDDISNWR